jgi:hypothetical protein
MGAKQSSITQTSTTPASAPSAPPKETSRTINASVSFTGTQFIITNEDKYDWTDVKLELNGGFFSGGYELKHRLSRQVKHIRSARCSLPTATARVSTPTR